MSTFKKQNQLKILFYYVIDITRITLIVVSVLIVMLV